MSDIVARLRDKNCCDTPNCNCDDAADEITALRAEVERLRAALERLSCECRSNCDWEKHGDICPSWIARAALGGKDE